MVKLNKKGEKKTKEKKIYGLIIESFPRESPVIFCLFCIW